MTNVVHIRRERGPTAVQMIKAGDKAAWFRKLLRDAELTPSDFKIACALSEFINIQDGRAWPSFSTLAKLTHLSERTVKYALKALVARGYFTVEKGNGRGHSNVYTFVPVNEEGAPEPTGNAAAVEAPANGAKNSHEPERKGAKSGPETVQKTTVKGARNAPLIKINNNNNKNQGAGTREALPERSEAAPAPAPRPSPGPSRAKPVSKPQAPHIPNDDPRYPALAAIHERLRDRPPVEVRINGKMGFPFRLDVIEEYERQQGEEAR